MLKNKIDLCHRVPLLYVLLSFSMTNFDRKLFSFFASIILLGFALDLQAEDSNLLDLSLEELSKIPVTSVSKHAEQLNNAPAAIFVLTGHEINRSGATSIPEALRLVPGLSVAKINSHYWAITSRGFNSLFANKLLVLVDGRTVYNSIFSGVNWEQIDLLLQDIERIEVIRGPGATVWGANAVNGVVNIISKRAKDTQGTYVTAGGGSEDKVIAGARHGFKIDEKSLAKIYTKGFVRDDSELLGEEDNYDSWKSIQSGFRYENQIDEDNIFTLHGDSQYGKQDDQNFNLAFQPGADRYTRKDSAFNWNNIVANWQHTLSKDSAIEVQAYHDRHARDYILADERISTSDIEARFNSKLSEHHQISSGIGYRYIEDSIDGAGTEDTANIAVVPRSKKSNITNIFAQDEITLYPKLLKFTLGTKLEHNVYSGLEVQPTAKLSYTPTEFSTIWSSFSRAVRTPSRVEDGIRFNSGFVPGENGERYPLVISGNKDAEAENLFAYEIGYRTIIQKDLTFDLSTFVNHYNDVFTNVPGAPIQGSNSQIEVPVYFENAESGDTYGVEAVVNWEPFSWWKVQGWYSYLASHVEPGVNKTSPNNQATIRSIITIDDKFEIDPRFRFVDTVTGLTGTNPIDSYFEFDLRLGYRLNKKLTLSVVGQNLLDDEHQEYINADGLSPVALAERGVFAKVDWFF